jgi:hypothetical protein
VTAVRVERARGKDPQRAAELDALVSLAEIYRTEINTLREAVLREAPGARPVAPLRDVSGNPVTMPAPAGQ